MGSICSVSKIPKSLSPKKSPTTLPKMSEMVEGAVCKVEEVEEGKMIEVDLNGNKVLVLRHKGKVKALSSKCTHYGAPLVKGSLSEDGIVRCPWHGACFSSDTGDIEDFPGLDSLGCYEVEEKDGEVVVRGRKDDLGKGRRVKAVSRERNEEETFVVIGGGAAGHTAVETLRQEGFKGRLVMVSKEDVLPYDRPKLSKKLNATVENIALRPPEWYQEADVETILGVEVVGIDAMGKKVVLSDDRKIEYNKVLIATGGKPRGLGVQGEDLDGVVTLRTAEQANYIWEKAEGKNVVIVGSSFIGMEVAAALADRAGSVTVIGRDRIPFLGVLGEDVGTFVMKMHQEKGVEFLMKEGVEKIEGETGEIKEVVLMSGKKLKADLVVVGVGVTPATDFLFSSLYLIGINMDKSSCIEVDENMFTGVDGVWAAGDIVSFPLATYGGKRVNIGHWGLAMYMGRVAARNMMQIQTKANTVPFFWTVQFGKSLRYAGYGFGWDHVQFEGDVESGQFVAKYCKDEDVLAVATLGKDPVAADFANQIKAGKVVKKTDILVKSQ